MRMPTESHITVDPELAVLTVLDVAAQMTIAVLSVFHPPVGDPECGRDHSHYLADRILADAYKLRCSLADYRQHLEVGPGGEDDDFPF